VQGVISLVFDKAVMEPTFCFMYAELCVHLSSGLPEFPPEEPDGKPICFKRVLLNTSQTEFEGADNMRAQLKEMSGPKLLEKEQLLKRRTLGNIRFIAELFKQKMLPKPIVNVCIRVKKSFNVDLDSLDLYL
jgi:translation initiation factor 4G